ncbi:MAG: bifunctional helix-turn-helix domain-containing protein/methylated-DNA--[protein]-cysteine S-methyltransferase [Burkholderiales bacterium]|nr:bifunctional helix-turn-helix domain-containing protein/methylated-DNA--[protein]-cysteine S-methyltransferase [Burkholderiales bacterium]
MNDPAAGTTSRDYRRIARAIAWLREHAAEQPDLAAAARALHLSEHHFQRLFTRWAGVSPKRFVQLLTLEWAKARLEGSPSLFDLSADAGLSGSGRLHDLFVALEAASPGEVRSGGAGLEIHHGLHDSPFGPVRIAASARGVCSVQFPTASNEGLAALRRQWPAAKLIHDPAATAALAHRMFGAIAEQPGRPLALVVKGTNFQVQVWRALLELSPGALTTYGRIAARIGAPRAARAVGAAVGANPIAWLIPCHRVIRESGALGGYHWGVERKTAMLAWEAARTLCESAATPLQAGVHCGTAALSRGKIE